VLHENGASTVWDDVFEDDKVALDEAVRAIQEGLDDELIDFGFIFAIMRRVNTHRAIDLRVRFN